MVRRDLLTGSFKLGTPLVVGEGTDASLFLFLYCRLVIIYRLEQSLRGEVIFSTALLP